MLLWLLAACDNELFPTPGGGGGGTVTGSSYADAKKIFDSTCTSCHNDGGSPLGGLNLQTDACAAIVGVDNGSGELLVDPGSHETSYLWKRIDAGEMPPSGKMAQANIDTIAAWIDAGASCGGDTGTTGDTGGTDYSFRMVQERVFDAKCVSCHVSGGYAADSLILTSPDSYGNLVDVDAQAPLIGKLVVAGDPESSVLIHKLRGTELYGTTQMPQGSVLDPELVALVYGWILSGAPQ